MKILAENRKAKFEWQIFEKYEAGIELLGSEVKSIKNGLISLRDSFVIIRNLEAYLLNTYIPPYQPKNILFNYDPYRKRKLLLKKKELKTLVGKTKQRSLTLIPLMIYTIKGKIKITIGLGKRVKKFEKREKIREREIERELEKEMLGH